VLLGTNSNLRCITHYVSYISIFQNKHLVTLVVTRHHAAGVVTHCFMFSNGEELVIINCRMMSSCKEAMLYNASDTVYARHVCEQPF
jgi:hypothetical protein